VTSEVVVVATGVTEDGRREILGIEIGDSEDEAFWREFLRALKRRGLSGVRLVISDQHAGLVAAIRRCFQGAGHQRCRVHFARNLLANIPKGHQEMVSAGFRTIFAQVSPEAISA
jgi:putative transposase